MKGFICIALWSAAMLAMQMLSGKMVGIEVQLDVSHCGSF